MRVGLVAYNLARALAALGHDVRLFTVGESTCPVPRLHHYPTAVEPMNDVASRGGAVAGRLGVAGGT